MASASASRLDRRRKTRNKNGRRYCSFIPPTDDGGGNFGDEMFLAAVFSSPFSSPPCRKWKRPYKPSLQKKPFSFFLFWGDLRRDGDKVKERERERGLNLQILRPLLSGPDFVLFPPSFPDDFRRRLSRRSAKDEGGKKTATVRGYRKEKKASAFQDQPEFPPVLSPPLSFLPNNKFFPLFWKKKSAAKLTKIEREQHK